MKKIICLLAFSIFNIACAQEKKSFNETATNAVLKTIDDKEITFKSILRKTRSKTTVIEVWASWCSDCVKNMPKLKELQAEFPNVNYVFLSADKTPEAWKKGIEKHEIIGQHFLITDGMKGTFGKAIDLDWIPRYIILNDKGEIVTYRAIETDFEAIKQTLKTLK